MSKTTIKVHADSDLNKLQFEYREGDALGKETAEFLNGLLAKAKAAKQTDVKNRDDEARFARLSKSVQDRELASYYAERAKEARLKG